MKLEVKISKKKINYDYAIKFLEKRVEDVFDGKKSELLWILQHNSIYTGGTGYNKKDIINKDIKVIKTKRGGKITHHGPGQVIVYFVINLKNRKKDIRLLIKNIECSIINILNKYNIKSFADRKNIGIWVNHNNEIKKIAAIGLRVKKWIAYHGFALNLNNDLELYKNIIPCGIINKKITNMKCINNRKYNNLNKKIIDEFINNLYFS